MRDSEESSSQNYISSLFAPEDELLQQIRKSCAEDNKLGMQVSSYEGQMLHFFAKMISAKRVVEVGTLYGYSALWMARALPDEGHLWALEHDNGHAAKAKAFFMKSEVSHKLQVIEGEALQSLNTISDQGPFDMIFIDANKAGYCDYLNWAEKNVREGGLIIGDNTFLFGHVFEEKENADKWQSAKEVMLEFNRRLSDKERYNGHIIDTLEGMTVAQKLF